MPPAVLKAHQQSAARAAAREAVRHAVPSADNLRESIGSLDMVSLREAKVVDPNARRVEVILLTVGKGNVRDRHYYTQQAIDSAASAFEGKPAFADHSSTTEEATRPERSVRDIIGYYEGVHADGPALKGVLQILPGAAYDWAWSLVQEAITHAQKFPGQNLAGISICARGETIPGQHDGEEWKDVTRILEARSADVVTLPARGGRFIQLTEDEGGSMKLGELMQAIRAKCAEIEAAAGDTVPMMKDLTRMVDQAVAASGQADSEEGQLIHLPDTGELPIIGRAEGDEAEADTEAFNRQAAKCAAERYAHAAEVCAKAAEAETDEAKKQAESERAAAFKRMAERYAAKAAEGAEAVPAVPAAKPEDEPAAAPGSPAEKPVTPPAAVPTDDKTTAQVESLRQEKDTLESRLILREANIPAGLVDLMVPAMKDKSEKDKRAFVEAKRQELGASLLETVRVPRFYNAPRSTGGNGSAGSGLLRQHGLVK